MFKKITRQSCATVFFFVIPLFASALTGCGGAGGSGAVASPVIVPTPPVNQTPLFPELRVLVLGQSISSNCNQRKYDAVPNVFQIGRDGAVKAAKDPFEWADCDQGSMWIPLGRNLVDSKIVTKVTFMPIGVAGSHIAEWQQGGRAYEKLNLAIAQIKQMGLSFDYAFWHQGSADIGMSTSEYQQRLASIVDYVNGKVKIDRWLIALHSRCSGSYSPEIEQAQRNVGDAPALQRYLGPNTNLLGAAYRMPDECHLNEVGQEEMARQWVDAIVNSAK